MPQKQDSRQQAIIEAAIQAFKQKGYEGARVDQIAADAGVNKATLYYRIGDKAALYETVLDHILGQLADELEQNLAASSQPEQQLHDHILIFSRCAREFAPIMLRELASGGETVPNIALRQMGRSIDALRHILQQGQQIGSFRATNPFIIHMMIIGGLAIYATNQPLRRRSTPPISHCDNAVPSSAPKITIPRTLSLWKRLPKRSTIN